MQTQKKSAVKIWIPVACLLLGLIAGMAIIYFSKNNSDKLTAYASSNIGLVTETSDSLESDFYALQDLNKQYATLLTNKDLDSTGLVNLDSLNMLITHEEADFLKKLDNLQINNMNHEQTTAAVLKKITNAYRAALDQSNDLSAIRNSINIGNTNYNFDQKMFGNMQSELSVKEMQVLVLSAQLATLKTTGSGSNVKVDYKSFLKQQDSAVNEVLRAQKKRNENLISYNDKLERDNKKLLNQVQSLQTQALPSNSAAVTNMSGNDVNEQLSLVKVDCYLTRADATQIISNGNQRKDLLQNALQILNMLMQSSNTSIRQQAQTKLDELKTIAANNHD